MLASKRGVYLPKLVLVLKRQPGVQMDLSSSDLPEKVQKLVKENSVKKIIHHVKTKNVLANYLGEKYVNENDTLNVFFFNACFFSSFRWQVSTKIRFRCIVWDL